MTTNEDLKQRIVDELRWEPRVEASNIGVEVRDGAVTLTGHVPTYPEKFAAEDVVQRVKGVKAVADEIEVRLGRSVRYGDSEMAERIGHVLTWNVSVPEDTVKARVRNGLVTLTGEVEWHYQKRHIEQQVRHVRGVVGIINEIRIRPRVAAGDVKSNIENALHRNADVEADRIDVRVDGGRVTIDGKVKARYERDLVERAVWAAAGVTDVIDNLRVD